MLIRRFASASEARSAVTKRGHGARKKFFSSNARHPYSLSLSVVTGDAAHEFRERNSKRSAVPGESNENGGRVAEPVISFNSYDRVAGATISTLSRAARTTGDRQRSPERRRVTCITRKLNHI